MSKMTKVKITIIVVLLGTMAMWLNNAGAFDKPLPPPGEIAPARTQILVDVVIPANATAEQINLYSRPLSLVCENGVIVGDTVQLKYFYQYDPPHETYFKLVSVKRPFYENVEKNQFTYTELLKGVVRVAVD